MTIKLQAPSGVGGGVQCSASGQSYTIGSDGTVSVQPVDVPSLLAAGFTYATAAAVVAAAGSTKDDAAALAAGTVTEVTGANDTKGVKLPASGNNAWAEVVNTDATHSLKVYPDAGGAINGGSADAAFLLGPGESARFSSTGALVWYAAAASSGAEVVGVAAGYKVARGSSSITGATGGDITTSLATVVAVCANLGEDADLTASMVTAALGGTAGHITLKVWKPTSNADPTPILSTNAKTVNWIAIGT